MPAPIKCCGACLRRFDTLELGDNDPAEPADAGRVIPGSGDALPSPDTSDASDVRPPSEPVVDTNEVLDAVAAGSCPAVSTAIPAESAAAAGCGAGCGAICGAGKTSGRVFAAFIVAEAAASATLVASAARSAASRFRLVPTTSCAACRRYCS